MADAATVPARPQAHAGATLLAFLKGDYVAAERHARAVIGEGALEPWTVHVLVTSVRRQGRVEDASSLAADCCDRTRERPWPNALLRLAIGATTLGDALGLALTEEQRCQAHYYAAAWLLAQGHAHAAEQALVPCRVS